MVHRRSYALLSALAVLMGLELACREQPPARSEPSPSEARSTSGCDADALGRAVDRIAASLASWTPESGTMPDLSLDAASAVWAHCSGLPEPAKRLLYAAVEHRIGSSSSLDAALPGHARYDGLDADATKAAWEWQASMLCPDFPAVAQAAGQVDHRERPAIFWDRCLHRFDFVTRDDYVRGGDVSGHVGFALYQWLTAAALDPAKASVLARALVFVPALSGPPADVFAFPVVEGERRPASGLRLEVRADSVHFEGERVAAIDPVRGLEGAPEGAAQGAIVPELYDRMAEEIDKSTAIAEARGGTWSKSLLLVAHRELPWSTLRPIITTAQRAGIVRIDAVGLTADPIEPLRSVTIHDATATGEVRLVRDSTSVQALVREAGGGAAPRLVP